MVLLGASSFRRLEQRQMHLSWEAGVTPKRLTPKGQVEGLGQPRRLPPQPGEEAGAAARWRAHSGPLQRPEHPLLTGFA